MGFIQSLQHGRLRYASRRLIRAMLAGASAGQASVSGVALLRLLLDQFTTTQAAPLTSPRTCEPGPGQLTITDASNIMSISSGQLIINGTAGAVSGLVGPQQSRRAGRALVLRSPSRTSVASVHRNGWANSASPTNSHDIGFDYSSPSILRIKSGVALIDSVALNTYLGGEDTVIHDIAMIMRDVGGFLLARAGGSGNYLLLWVYNTVNTAEYPQIHVAAGSLNMKWSRFQIIDLPAPWLTDYGIATSRLVSPVNAATATQTPDAIIEQTFNHASGSNTNLNFRIVDTNNFMNLVCRSSDGVCAITKTVAGTTTTVAQTSSAFTTGVTYRVVVVMEGSAYKVYSNQVLLFSGTAAENVLGTDIKVSAATTPSEVVAWPRTIALPVGA